MSAATRFVSSVFFPSFLPPPHLCFRQTPERPIPSQRWARHTLEDDPDYYAKREEYHRNKKSFLDRLLPDSHDGHH